jgi:ketosteroid isomerase-like protein
MSPDNVQVVRELFDRVFVRRDFDAALLLLDGEVILDWSDSRSPYSTVFRGHAEIRTMWEEWSEVWEEWTPRITDAIEVDPETVLLETHVQARGRGSGVPVVARGATIWRLRDGKVVHGKLFQSKDEALDAL